MAVHGAAKQGSSKEYKRSKGTGYSRVLNGYSNFNRKHFERPLSDSRFPQFTKSLPFNRRYEEK